MEIILGKTCTIRQLDSHIEKLKQELLGTNEEVIVDVSILEKIDTAYLQMVLSIVQYIKKENRTIGIRGNSEALNIILKCYGIALI